MQYLQRKYPYGHSSSEKALSEMSVADAHRIVQQIADYEFPALFLKGLFFALFRTYGIPSISGLLVKTQQLSTEQWAGKRYADTGILLSEIYATDPGSDRAIDAFSRLNYLHGHYIKGGKIRNDDMLYTLALFLNQPLEWIHRYEWRRLTEAEICALGVFHLYMGKSMEIDLSVLPSGPKDGKEGTWRDGIHFYDELDQWAKEYEVKAMVPAQVNYDTAVHTRSLLLMTNPRFMHDPLKKLVSAVMDERLRKAMMFDDPPRSYIFLLNGFMVVRRLVLRWLSLPRFVQVGGGPYVSEPGRAGQRWFTRYDTLPHVSLLLSVSDTGD